MLLFEDLHQVLYPTSRIRSITPVRRDPGDMRPLTYRVLFLDDEQSVNISQQELRKLQEEPAFVVPAQEGCTLISSIQPDGDEAIEIWKAPLIGWAITSTGEALAITADGIHNEPDDQTVLLPGGKVHAGFNQWYDDVKAWKKTQPPA